MLSLPCVEEYAASCTSSPSVLTWLRLSGPSIRKSPLLLGLPPKVSFPNPWKKGVSISWKPESYRPASLKLGYWHILEFCVVVCCVFWQGPLFCSLDWPGIYCLAQASLSLTARLIGPSHQASLTLSPAGHHSVLSALGVCIYIMALHYFPLKLLSFCLWEFFQLNMPTLFALTHF